MKRTRAMRAALILLLALTAALTGACSLGGNNAVSPAPSSTVPAAEAPAEMTRQGTATLYFRYLDEPYLAPESRVVNQTPSRPYEQVLISALLSGPTGHDLTALFPPGTRVISTTRQGRTLFVTFSPELLGAYADEPDAWAPDPAWQAEVPLRRLLCMQGIAATITENCDVDRVQILVQQPRIPQEEIDRVKSLLREYAERVNSGSTSFSTLARLYSEDPGSARQGGEMPYMGRGELDPGFANVAFGMTDPKKVSKIAQSEFGYHIIQLVDKRGDKIKCRHILKRPEVAQADIDTALVRLDSIAEQIRRGRVSFEDAASVVSDDKDTRNNHGILTNTKKDTGERTTRFEMDELSALSPELARAVDGLETGEISKPITMVNSKGMTVCAIVKLKNRIKSHRANISEDFQVMKAVVERKKKEEKVLEWLKEKQKSTYIRINPDWRDCDFQYPGWLK